MMRRAAALFCLILTTPLALNAAAPAAPRQDTAAIRAAVDSFLRGQTSPHGKTTADVGRIDQRLNLPACTQLQTFFPRGSKAWGQTTVGVRCTTPARWTVYVSATVKVDGRYLVAAVPLAQGQQIGAADVAIVEGDLAALPAGVVTDSAQAVGRNAAKTVAMGEPLRTDALRNQQAVQQGQVVRLVSSGPGFEIAVVGRALTNATEGQLAQAKTPAGKVVSGIARMGGILEVAY